MFSLLNKEVKNIIVFDLEWNQSSFHTNHRIPHEIIEIGACRVSREGNVLDRFSRLIRPRVYQKLDKHIKQVRASRKKSWRTASRFPMYSAISSRGAERMCSW